MVPLFYPPPPYKTRKRKAAENKLNNVTWAGDIAADSACLVSVRS